MPRGIDLVTVNVLLGEVMQRKVPALPSETALADVPGWDSIMVVRLMLLIEARLGRELTEPELESLETLGDIARIIEG